MHPVANSHGRQRQGATEVVSKFKMGHASILADLPLDTFNFKKAPEEIDYFFLWLIFQLKARILLLDYF